MLNFSLSASVETLTTTLTLHTLAEFQCECGKFSLSLSASPEIEKFSLSLSAGPESGKFSLSLSAKIETLIKLTPNTLTLRTHAEF